MVPYVHSENSFVRTAGVRTFGPTTSVQNFKIVEKMVINSACLDFPNGVKGSSNEIS